MKIKEIREQFERVLKDDLKLFVDDKNLIRRHPNYPIISKIKLNPHNITLNEDQIDSLNEGEFVSISFEIPGQYTKTQRDGNVSAPNSFFTLTVTELKIGIEDRQLIIKECNCFASVDQV